ncbi:MAG: hypothetical protein WA890_17330, partial [Micromonospora sp.]
MTPDERAADLDGRHRDRSDDPTAIIPKVHRPAPAESGRDLPRPQSIAARVPAPSAVPEPTHRPAAPGPVVAPA